MICDRLMSHTLTYSSQCFLCFKVGLLAQDIVMGDSMKVSRYSMLPQTVVPAEALQAGKATHTQNTYSSWSSVIVLSPSGWKFPVKHGVRTGSSASVSLAVRSIVAGTRELLVRVSLDCWDQEVSPTLPHQLLCS